MSDSPPKTTTILGKVPPQKRFVIIERWKYNYDKSFYWSTPHYIEDCYINPYAIEYLYTIIGKFNQNTHNGYTMKEKHVPPWRIPLDPLDLTDIALSPSVLDIHKFNQMYFTLCLYGKIRISSFLQSSYAEEGRNYEELFNEFVKSFMCYFEEMNVYLPKLVTRYKMTEESIIETYEEGFQMIKNETCKTELPRFYSVVATLNIGRDVVPVWSDYKKHQ